MAGRRRVQSRPRTATSPIAARDIGELVAAAREGDRHAFDALVQATYRDTYRLALRLTDDEEDARDVVQEVYLRAYRALSRFRGDATFSTWLYRITANCAASHRSRAVRHRYVPIDDDVVVIDSHPRADPERLSEAASLRRDLEDALASLPPRLRAVVVLRDIYDLPHGAIASELGITETAAKVRLHRARLRLREGLFASSGGRRSEH